jgi:hypothetical protein
MFNFTDSDSIRVNSTSISLHLMLRDPSGNALTGLAFGDMTGSYCRQGATRQAITVVVMPTPAVDDVWTSGGFIEIDATNQPGLYRFDVPNAAFVHGVDHVSVSLIAAGMEPKTVNLKLTHDGLIRAFIPQALAAGSLTLDAGADAGDGAFLGKSFVVIYSDDATDLGAMFLAHTSYTGGTKVALGTWTRVPTGTVGTMVVLAVADGFAVSPGTITTLDALDTAQDSQHATTQADTAAILLDTGTDGVVLSAAAVDAILDEVVAGSTTMREALRGFLAVLLGKASGLGTATAVFRDVADTMPVVTATVDADGNRTAVTLDLDDTP